MYTNTKQNKTKQFYEHRPCVMMAGWLALHILMWLAIGVCRLARIAGKCLMNLGWNYWFWRCWFITSKNAKGVKAMLHIHCMVWLVSLDHFPAWRSTGFLRLITSDCAPGNLQSSSGGGVRNFTLIAYNEEKSCKTHLPQFVANIIWWWYQCQWITCPTHVGENQLEQNTCTLGFPVQSGFPLIFFRIEGLVEVAQMAADSAAGADVVAYDEAMGMVSNSWKSVRFMPHIYMAMAIGQNWYYSLDLPIRGIMNCGSLQYTLRWPIAVCFPWIFLFLVILKKFIKRSHVPTRFVAAQVQGKSSGTNNLLCLDCIKFHWRRDHGGVQYPKIHDKISYFSKTDLIEKKT